MEVREWFDTLPTRADPAKTASMINTYFFDVEGASKWRVDVKEGTVTVAENGADDTDVTLTAAEDVFKAIVNGEQNATSAYMTGKLKIRGDMGAAMKLQNLF